MTRQKRRADPLLLVARPAMGGETHRFLMFFQTHETLDGKSVLKKIVGYKHILKLALLPVDFSKFMESILKKLLRQLSISQL